MSNQECFRVSKETDFAGLLEMMLKKGQAMFSEGKFVKSVLGPYHSQDREDQIWLINFDRNIKAGK